jgi:hypothetical protein
LSSSEFPAALRIGEFATGLPYSDLRKRTESRAVLSYLFSLRANV